MQIIEVQFIFHLNYFPVVSLIDNKPGFVQVMAWHLAGHKPLPEPMGGGMS